MMSAKVPAYGALWEPLVTGGEAAVLRTAVCEKTAARCARDHGNSLRAVVLTGSLARDEGTWVREGAAWRLLGDAEFLLVFETGAALPPQAALDSLMREIQDLLRCNQILARVQVVPVHPRYLRELEPHIFAYELRTGGRVVWGDCSILSLIPSFTAADIPLEDAWSLLMNRMIEQLEAAARIETFTQSVPEGLRYRTIKLYLDMATSLLLFAGSYAPAYRERQRRLTTLADADGTDENWPFPLGPFAQQVSASTDLKLSSERPNTAETEWEFWRQSIRHARLLWRWELARLTGASRGATEGELMRSWVRRQRFAQRLRGWMFVWRACGWLRSWHWWPRWRRLAAGGSPRYWVYSAAYNLFCQLPEVLEDETGREITRALFGEVAKSLPVLRLSRREGRVNAWAALVDEVTWNYHRFLEPTRA